MQATIKKLWGNEFLKGGAVFTISSFLGNILNYLFNIFTARALGPAGFGEIAALFSYTIIFSVPTLVMSLVIIQKIGAQGDGAEKYAIALNNWFVAKLKKWWFYILPSLLITPFIPHFTNLSPVSGYILIPFIVLSFVGAFYNALLQGLALLMWVSFIGLITTALKLAGALFALGGLGGLNMVIAFLMVSTVVPLYISYVIVKKRVGSTESAHSHKINKRIIHAILDKQVIITFLSILAITIFNNIDVIFVKKSFNADQAGIYSSWSLFAKIILYLTGPVSMVSFIFFSSKKSSNNHERVLTLSLIALLIIALSSFIVYNYFSLFVINFFFGKKFLPVAPYLASASLFGSFYTTITFINNYFLAKKSNISIALLVIMPLYFIGFYVIPKTLSNIIWLNIYFSGGVTLVYLVAYALLVFYNRPNGKRKS